jgi:predicted secreted protein
MKNKILLILVTILFFLISCSPPPQLQKPLTVENNTEMKTQNDLIVVGCRDSIALKKGQRLFLKLPATAGTGFQWQLKDNAVSSILKINESDEIQYEDATNTNEEKPAQVGQKKLQVLDFQAIRTGSIILNLVYLRPFETHNVEQSCSIRIIINH